MGGDAATYVIELEIASGFRRRLLFEGSHGSDSDRAAVRAYAAEFGLTGVAP